VVAVAATEAEEGEVVAVADAEAVVVPRRRPSGSR